MTERQHSTDQHNTDQRPGSGEQDSGELSLQELESEIAGAEALVQDLNQRLKQTADDRR